jgi:hypothetical protein
MHAHPKVLAGRSTAPPTPDCASATPSGRGWSTSSPSTTQPDGSP